MLKANFSQSTNTLTMEFIYGPNVEKHEFKVRDAAHANHLYRINTNKYIVNTLNKWVKHTKYRLSRFNTMTSQRQFAIDALELMLYNYSESKLEVLIRQIIKNERNIRALAPNYNSRFYDYYFNTIVAIINWCIKQSQQEG